MAYPIILNGDHAEFEREHANTKPEDRPDWPLPSFDASDWAKAFCKIANRHGYKDAEGKPLDEGWMQTWFANALMRGFDEHAARSQPCEREILEAAIDKMGWPEIHAFKDELRRGQDIREDAGGFMMRAIRRLFGLPSPYSEITTYQQAARSMIAAAQNGGE